MICVRSNEQLGRYLMKFRVFQDSAEKFSLSAFGKYSLHRMTRSGRVTLFYCNPGCLSSLETQEMGDL